MRLSELLVPDPPGAGVIGVEREYRVVQDGRAVDFRTLLPGLGLVGGGLDPGDPRARHLPCGILVTADGAEAEVATPPVTLAPGATRVASAWVERGEDLLVGALPAGTGIEGYSTHVNVAVRGDVVDIATRFASHFALPMMLLLDRRDSPGLLVRPRPGRLELGGDFVAGEQLRAALTFAVAAARCCERTAGHVLPIAPTANVRTVLDRPGWFIPRDAFGPDLYDIGRDAVVRVGGRDVRAGDQLAETWAAARPVAVEVSDSSELDVVDAQVEGRSPIPLEALSPPDAAAPAGALTSSFARLHARHRDGLSVTVASLSWAAVAFDVRMPSRACHVVVPRRWLDSFLRCVDDGTITTTLASSAADERPSAGPYVVTGPFRPDAVLAAEPRARTPWWRHRRAELIGVAAGAVATLAALAATRW